MVDLVETAFANSEKVFVFFNVVALILLTLLLLNFMSYMCAFHWLTWLTRQWRENTDASKLLDSLIKEILFFLKYGRPRPVDFHLAI